MIRPCLYLVPPAFLLPAARHGNHELVRALVWQSCLAPVKLDADSALAEPISEWFSTGPIHVRKVPGFGYLLFLSMAKRFERSTLLLSFQEARVELHLPFEFRPPVLESLERDRIAAER